MKVGLSTYSLVRELRDGNMTVLDVIDWIAENGGEHMEIVPYGFSVVDNVELALQIKKRAEATGIELSAYSCQPILFSRHRKHSSKKWSG